MEESHFDEHIFQLGGSTTNQYYFDKATFSYSLSGEDLFPSTSAAPSQEQMGDLGEESCADDELTSGIVLSSFINGLGQKWKGVHDFTLRRGLFLGGDLLYFFSFL